MAKENKIKIAVTGPESTGKSDLSKSLAERYNGVWIPEVARDYLENSKGLYNYDDILKIAIAQNRAMMEGARRNPGYLFADTELLVIKVWCEYKYQKCHPWIMEKIREQQFDLYLLMNIDLPWQPDPLREHPDKRRELFEIYRNELENLNWPYEIISGTGKTRTHNAIKIIDSYL